MKNITKLTPDPGVKDYDVVNLDGVETYVHEAVLSYDVISPSESLVTDIAFYDQTHSKVIIARIKDYSKLPENLTPSVLLSCLVLMMCMVTALVG